MVRVVSNVVSNQVVIVYPYDASEWYGPSEIENRIEELVEEEVWLPKRETIGEEI